MSLTEALEQVELEPGTHYCKVRGVDVEVRVQLPKPTTDPVSAWDESDVMLDAWCALPEPSGGKVFQAVPGPPPPIDIPMIPSEHDDEIVA